MLLRLKEKSGKMERILGIYTKLIEGYVVNKFEEAVRFGVNERSIERDIEDIRKYFDRDIDSNYHNAVIFDKNAGGYVLEHIYAKKFNQGEILAICKILLDSRAFPKEIMVEMLDKLIRSMVEKQDQKEIINLIRNEEFHYVNLTNQSDFISNLWCIGKAISLHKKLKITYKKLEEKEPVERILNPLSIMFSDFYFYLIAFIDDVTTIEKELNYDSVSPTIYRVDRIMNVEVLEKRFYIPYTKRFEEGEYRKRVQFMFGGKLNKIKFKYSGKSIEAVLDRLPTARILNQEKGIYSISAETYGEGIEMWLKSQGESVFDIER